MSEGKESLGRSARVAALFATTMLAFPSAAMAQNPDDGTIVVTAQKRTENLQDVPIAITALGEQKLQEMQVQKFEDYARYLPSVSFQNTAGPGSAKVYFRGLSSGENANPSSSQPTVGIYLDEMPITTISGALDIHMYDIARVEALAGPQGTLYGAASEAGTIRIITNKPDTKAFKVGADVEVNSIAHGGTGYVAQGFVNAPLTDRMALRVVGWYKRDAGYIDNIPGTYSFPSSGIVRDNAQFVEKNYNDVTTFGGRAALKIDLDDDWTVTPQIMGQKQKSHGSFGVESGLGDLQTMQFSPERAKDNWYQATLQVEGKLGTWDLTYAGGYLRRKVDSMADYSDYEYAYERYYPGWGTYFYDNEGNLIDPTWQIHNIDRYTKQNHELRIASPATERVKMIAGLFYQRQTHGIQNNYTVPGLADALSVTGLPETIWKTAQKRIDRDYAAFGEVTFDVTDQLALTAGTRYYKYNNTLVGFAGMGGFNPAYGEGYCFAGPIINGSPCTNVQGKAKDHGWLYKFNATYKFNSDALIYATASRGFRPGGVNRRPGVEPYGADAVRNLEAGWKTSWLDRRLIFNGAVYQLNWKNFQISTLDRQGLTIIQNAGDARIRGAEVELTARPVTGLSLSASGSYNDAKTTKIYCASVGDVCDPAQVLAPKGTRLPLTPKFKMNAIARYEFPVGDNRAFIQGAVVHESVRSTDLRTVENSIKGDLNAYTMFDLSGGLTFGNWRAEIYATNIFDKRSYSAASTQCLERTCGDTLGLLPTGPKIYRTPMQPRKIGVKLGLDF